MADELGFCAEHGKFGLGAPICPTCAVKASNELKALRAEVERLKVAEGEAMLVVESQDVSIANLRAEVAGWHRSSADLLDQIHDLEQVAANLRVEVAKCQKAYGKLFNENAALQGEIDALKARLAKFEGPLTDEQHKVLFGDMDFCNAMDTDALDLIDAAIRAAREGERE